MIKTAWNIVGVPLILAVFLVGCSSASQESPAGENGGGNNGSGQASSDVTPPTLTLIGASPITLGQGQAYVELGVKGVDEVDGDISSQVQVTGSVDANQAGDYVLTYRLTDGAGNTASITRTVTVVFAAPMPVLNDTGLMVGGNAPNGNNADCSGETIAQQDCSVGRDAQSGLTKMGAGMAAFDFTKLGADGQPLAIQNQAWDKSGSELTGSRWSCVKDNVTGLIWEVKTDDAKASALRSKQDVFSWYHSQSATNGGNVGALSADKEECFGYTAGDAASYCHTEGYVNRVNSTALCGITAWRLPSLNELQSIAHFGQVDPAIDHHFFPNTLSTGAWTSSFYTDELTWTVDFRNGGDATYYRTDMRPIRLVHREEGS